MKEQPEPTNKGYIPLSRKFFEHPLWKEKRTFSYAEAWIDLIQMARYESTSYKILSKGQFIEFGRGESLVSYSFLSSRWEWSRSKTGNFIRLLENSKMITRRTPPGTTQTIIRITNYDLYNFTDCTQKIQQRDETNKENKEKKESDTHSQNPEYRKFREWMQRETPYCANPLHFTRQITEEQFFRLKKEYTPSQISHILLSIENRKDLRKKYNNLYTTTLKWLQREYGNK